MLYVQLYRVSQSPFAFDQRITKNMEPNGFLKLLLFL